MSDEKRKSVLRERLFADPNANVFALLDGASVPGLVRKLWETSPEHYCLFPGTLEPDMAEVAPYVVKLEAETPFTQWVLDEFWGNHWGVFAVAPATGREMRGHCRSIVKVLGPDGDSLIFRYYDPRVLRTFLATCQPEELDEMFGPTLAYWAEAEDPDVLLCFRNDHGTLSQQEIQLAGN